MAERNRQPRDAMRSRFGVRFMGLSPMAPMQSQRNWSEMMRRTLGRAPPLAVCAAAEEATAAAADALNHSRLVCMSDATMASVRQVYHLMITVAAGFEGMSQQSSNVLFEQSRNV